MGLLSREQILNADDRPTRDIDVPEWGGSVRVRALNQREVSVWRRSLMRPVNKLDPKTRATKVEYELIDEATDVANPRLIAVACIKENGEAMFTLADVEQLATKSLVAVERVGRVIREISGLAYSFEDIEKNSAPNPSVSISSD